MTSPRPPAVTGPEMVAFTDALGCRSWTRQEWDDFDALHDDAGIPDVDAPRAVWVPWVQRAGPEQLLVWAGRCNEIRAARWAAATLEEGQKTSEQSRKLRDEKREQRARLEAESAFVGEPSIDTLDGFYQTADALVHGRQLEPCTVVALLRAYATSLGLLPREVGWALRTARSR